MSLEDNKLWAEVDETDPDIGAEGSSRPLRTTKFRELVTMPLDSKRVGRDGNYYVLRNATPATGIAGHAAATTLDDTKPFCYMRNDSTAAAPRLIELDYIRTWVTAAGTGGTNLRFGIKTDTGTARYTSGGTAVTPVNPNMQSANAASMTAYLGAIVAAAASSSVRLVSHGLIRTVINVVGDSYTFNFGRGQLAGSGIPTEGTLQAHLQFACPPITIGPTDQFLFHFFSGSQSAASSHEWECGFWYR